jgi:hypothetical protein
MMNKILIAFITIFSCFQCIGQKTDTIYLSPNEKLANKYIIIYPETKPYKGFMFLIPGMFQKGSDVLIQTTLPQKSAQKGILTIIPTFETGISSFGIDNKTQQSFIEILDDVIKRNHLENVKFYLGGFSIGGSCAIKYAELAISNNWDLKPTAVFALDSPLDFERMYNAMKREARLPNRSDGAREEADYMFKRFKGEFGGSPKDNLNNYHKLSPYSFNDTLQTAIKPLARLPLRLYTEPDILWWLDDTTDYYGMNAFDFAALTNELRRMGNTKVELIVTENKGFRKPNNVRHPHSWSIIDPDSLIAWLLLQE